MPASPASFNTLPNEIHTLIINEVSNRDGVYRKEKIRQSALARQQGKPLGEPYASIRAKGQTYGNSLMALYSTCKLMRALASPFVFKILPLSQTFSTLFRGYIEPHYSLSFTTLILDSLDDVPELDEDDSDEFSDDSMEWNGSESYRRREDREKEAIDDFLLYTLPQMTSISRIEIPAYENYAKEVLGRLDWLYGTAKWTHKREKSHAKHARDEAEKATQAISKSITCIEIQSDAPTDVDLPHLFSNLEEVSLSDYSSRAYAGLQIPSLKHLTSLAVQLRGQVIRHDQSYLPKSWIDFGWDSQDKLKQLDLDLPTISDPEWRFILTFDNLSSLSLHFNKWTVGHHHQPHTFGQLENLTLAAEKQEIVKALDRISRPSTLRTLKLVITPSSSGPQDRDILYQPLTAFEDPKRTLELQLLEHILPATRAGFANYTNSRTFQHATLTSLAPFKRCEVSLGQYHGSSREGELEKAKWQNSTLQSFLANLQGKLQQAERVGDSALLEKWSTWIEPLVGRSTLDSL